MTALQVFIFYGLADKYHANMALWQMLLVLSGTHLAVFYSILVGTLDSYTLTVVIHQALLITGAQFIHLLTFQRKAWHRWLYVANTLSALVEFTISNLWPAWINRNSNYCPTLTDAISSVRKERERWTIFLLVLSFVLSLSDATVRAIDTIRNKDVDRKKGDHSIPTLPRCILWDRNLWNRRRRAYLAIGVLFYLLSIYNVEVNIIRYFHEVVQQVGGLSSAENGWGFGQVVAIFVALIAFGATVRNYLIHKLAPFAKKTKSIKPERPLSDLICRSGSGHRRICRR